MPRIGRSFPPQWMEPNIGGSERALGPEPPQVLAGPPFAPISVNLATGLLTNQRRAQQRRTQIVRGTPIVETGGVGAISTGSASGNTQVFGNSTVIQGLAVGFTPAANVSAISLAVPLRLSGSPTDDVLVTLQTDSGGNPSGTILATLDVPAASLGTTIAWFAATFAAVPLSAGTQYWVVFGRSGAVDASNFYVTARSSLSFGAATPGYPNRILGSGGWGTSTTPAWSFSLLTAGDTLAAYASTIGPQPPLVINPPPGPPVVTTITVTTFAAQARRRTETRRFPLQGWEQTPCDQTNGNPYPLSPQTIVSFDSFPTSAQVFGTGVSAQAVACFFSFAGNVQSCRVAIAVEGSPLDNIVATIESDSGGVPSGIVLATSTPVAGASLDQSGNLAPVTFTFPSSSDINGPVWFVLRRDALDAVNFYKVGKNSVNFRNYVMGAFFTRGSSNWFSNSSTAYARLTFTPFASQIRYQQRFLGPRPPLVIGPLPSQPQQTVGVRALTQSVVRRQQAQQRAPHSDLFGVIPQVSAQPPPPIQVNLASGLYTNQRRVQQRRPDTFYTESPYLSPLAVVTTPGQLAVTTHETRIRPRPVRSSLPLVTATFVAPPISVNLQAVQTRVQRQRRRLPDSFLSPPATLEPETVALAERQIRVTLARLRPRHTVGTRLGYTVYPATSEIAVALVRTRPRPTLHALSAITYPQAGIGFTHLVHTRPRPTSKLVAPPATLQPYAVTVAEDTIRVVLARTRPRPTTRRLAPPTVLQTFAAPRTPLVRIRPRHTAAFVAPPATLEPEAVSLAEREIRVVLTRTRPRHTVGTRLSYTIYPQTSKIAVALVRTRPRPTVHSLTAISYPATSEITVLLARTRPRPTARRLSPPIFYASTSEISFTLTRTRPRPTTRFLAPPTTLQTFGPPVESEIAVRVPADDRARRKPRSFQIQPVTNAATSEISVTLTRSRPRPTRRLLTAVTYPATSEITVALVRARSRPLTHYVAPPATLQPYSVTLAEDTVRVAAVRTRPRHTLGTRLNPPTVLRTFAGPAVTLTHTRPRPTLRRLAPPTVIRVPSVEQREDTITVALVHTRPRPTEKFIVPPVVRTFPPVVTTLLPAHVVKTRPRPTTRFLRPPTVVIPLPTLRMQTITVATVRTRPRPTRHSLTPLAFYKQTSKIQVVLARTRPRPTTKRLSPAIFYKQTSEIAVVLARTRPRPTTRILTAVRYEQTSEITVTLARTRPRATRHFVAPPTVLQTFGPPVEVEIAVRTPLEDRARRRPRSFAIRPVTYAATSKIAVAVVRARPRKTSSRLAPPTVLRAFAAAPATVALVRTRPRRTQSFLLPPTAVRTFVAAPILVATVATRPRPTTARIEPPTRLRPAGTNVRVTLARTRPRHVRSNLTPVAVVTQPPTVTTLTVVLTRTRPRPTRNLLAAPATLRRVVVFIAEPLRVTTVTTRPPRTRSEFVGGPIPELISLCGWTSGEVVAATDSAGSSILVSGTQGGAVVVASTESEVKPVAESRGEDSATGRTEGMDKLAGT